VQEVERINSHLHAAESADNLAYEQIHTGGRYNWTDRFSNTGGGNPSKRGPWAQSDSCTICAPYLTRGLSGRSVTSTTHPYIAATLKKEYSHTSNPPLDLPGLW